MLKCHAIGGSTAEVKYYTALGRDAHEYYSERTRPGRWFGAGAAEIGLAGDVTEEVFGNLLVGKSPDGKSVWVQPPKNSELKRRCGFDLTFQVPKSVSAAWAQASTARRDEIISACERALQNTLEVFEQFCSGTRRGRNGHVHEEAGLIGAVFQHDTARPKDGNVPDPHLHWHCVVVNMALREDGTVGAWNASPLFKKSMTVGLGTLFRAEVSKVLRDLGLSSHRPTKEKRPNEQVSWFELDCVPQSLRKEQSKRSDQIERLIKELGLSGWRAKAEAALKTREAKRVFSAGELDAAWLKSGIEHGFTRLELEQAIKQQPKVDTKAVSKECLQKAVSRLSKERSRFSTIDLIRYVAEEAQTTGAGIEDAVAVVQAAQENLRELVRLREVDGEQQWTTREILRLESRMLSRAARLADKFHHQVELPDVEAAIAKHPTLGVEQAEAIRYMTLGSDLACVNGVAGAGKSYVMSVARALWGNSGYSVVGTALQKKRARTFQEETEIDSQHIHQLLKAIDRGEVEIDAKTIICVDEAGMIGTRQMEALVTIVERAGAKLVLSGGYDQIQAIDAGAPMRVLAEQNSVCEMNEIRRQHDEWQRQLVHNLRAGEAGKVLWELVAHKCLYVGKDRFDAMAELVTDWSLRAIKETAIKECVIIAGTNEDVSILNRLAQSARFDAGHLGEQSIRVGEFDFHIGDRVMATRNSAARLIDNGMEGEITDIDGDVIRVRFDGGPHLLIDTADFKHLSLAYASTVHRSQGETKDSCFFLTDDIMTDRHQAYVGGSRHRREVKFYSDVQSGGQELDRLAKHLERERRNDLAHEYLEQTLEAL